MGRFYLPALIACLALVGVAGASGQTTSAATSGGPFVLKGDISIEGTSGFDGDRNISHGKAGMQLGCLSGRHYAFAVTVTNQSGTAVTLLSAQSPNPAAQVIDPLATQLRHAPPPSTGDRIVIVLRKWSATRSRPVAVRPGRSAVIQSNFLMRNCSALVHGRTVTVPGSLRLRYRLSGRTASEKVVQANTRLVLVAGPTRRSCNPVAGAVRAAASDISCALARAAAPVCRHMNHGNYGTDCSAAGLRWDCDLRAVNVQWCWRAGGINAHWYRVRWERKKH
jgi:hypothetical protein